MGLERRLYWVVLRLELERKTCYEVYFLGRAIRWPQSH
jgi:hypothetical protein